MSLTKGMRVNQRNSGGIDGYSRVDGEKQFDYEVKATSCKHIVFKALLAIGSAKNIIYICTKNKVYKLNKSIYRLEQSPQKNNKVL